MFALETSITTKTLLKINLLLGVALRVGARYEVIHQRTKPTYLAKLES